MTTVRCTTRPELGRSAFEVRFRAMGTDAHVLVTGPEGEPRLRHARDRISELEARWSRFVADSDVSRANAVAGSGTTITIAPETVALFERARLAWTATEGVWNPLLGTRLEALGYDRSFDAGLEAGPSGPESFPAPSLDQIAFDPVARTLALPAGAGLDFGGIAKGFAADLVTSELIEGGAWGALVSLGGDLRVRGMSPIGLDWGVAIGEAAIGLTQITTVRLTEGGLATSTTARRRWPAGQSNHHHHHLLDPGTSLPAETDIVLTTAIAGSAWWAEVCATARTIDPTLDLPRHAALQVDTSGGVTRTHDFARYES